MDKETKAQKTQRWRKLNPWGRYLEFAKRRCSDPKHKSYKSHGAKGIAVELKLADVKYLWHRDNAAAMRKPSLDRKKTDQNYTLNNCRFMEFNLNARRAWDPMADINNGLEPYPSFL